MASEVPREIRDPYWVGPMGHEAEGWLVVELVSSCWSRRSTIRSRVLLITLSRWIERQLLGWV